MKAPQDTGTYHFSTANTLFSQSMNEANFQYNFVSPRNVTQKANKKLITGHSASNKFRSISKSKPGGVRASPLATLGLTSHLTPLRRRKYHHQASNKSNGSQQKEGSPLFLSTDQTADAHQNSSVVSANEYGLLRQASQESYASSSIIRVSSEESQQQDSA